MSDGSKLGPLGSAPGPGQSSRKSSDSGHSPGPDSCSCSSSSHDNNSSDIRSVSLRILNSKSRLDAGT